VICGALALLPFVTVGQKPVDSTERRIYRSQAEHYGVGDWNRPMWPGVTLTKRKRVCQRLLNQTRPSDRQEKAQSPWIQVYAKDTKRRKQLNTNIMQEP
jgi:hypothetical protein